MKIAIDGPAGAGKSTIAKEVARRKGFVYIDTGAMYRGIALFYLKKQVDLTDESSVKERLEEIDITFRNGTEGADIFLNGENVSETIRQEEVGKGASVVAKYPAVREKLVDLQRRLADQEHVIMDGRDIGTVVLPDAECKIYLTASSGERAKRRYLELKAKGVDCDLDEIEQEIIKRDTQDMNRKISPLKKAEDAVELDTTGLSPEEVIQKILTMIEEC